MFLLAWAVSVLEMWPVKAFTVRSFVALPLYSDAETVCDVGRAIAQDVHAI